MSTMPAHVVTTSTSDQDHPPPHAPLASAWNFEKSASIDWTNADDVLASGLTFIQILTAHPQLDAYYRTHLGEKAACVATFRSLDRHLEQRELLRQWAQKGLLTLRGARWCRHCGCEGHTKLQCPQLAHRHADESDGCGLRTAKARTRALKEDNPRSATTTVAQKGASDGTSAVTLLPSSSSASAPTPQQGKVWAKFQAHQVALERLRLLEEKKRRSDTASGHGGGGSGSGGAGGFGTGSASRPWQHGPGARGGDAQRRGTGGQSSAATNSRDLALFSEERRRGVVGRLDTQHNIGFVRVADLGDVKFFVDRVDYGVKEIAVGDTVTLKIDQSRDYPIAIDVRPEKSTVTMEDTCRFLLRCKQCQQNGAQPIELITMLLTHQHEWYELLRYVNVLSERPDTLVRFIDAVHTLIELTTFIGNREPIHLAMLQAFLKITLTAAMFAPDKSCPPFFPNMVQASLEAAERWPDPAADANRTRERYVDVVQYVVLLRQHTAVAADVVEPTQALLTRYFEGLAATDRGHRRLVEAALTRLRNAAVGRAETLLIPSAAEFSVPPPDPRSAFSPANLPVNGQTTFTTTEAFVTAQCQLLRADTFEAMSRLLPALCYRLPQYTPSPETVGDMAHARLYHRVRFVGQVLTRDREYDHPDSYIFEVQPKSEKANLRAQLHQGTTVVFSTSLDRSRLSDDDLFWGVVSSCDSHLLRANMVVITPCESSTSFALLVEHLRRNEAQGRLEDSLLLEAPLFMAGYASILTALTAFLGPLAMPLPMADRLIGPTVVQSDGTVVKGSPNTTTASGESDQGAAATPTTITTTTTTAGRSSPRSGKLISYIPPHCAYAFRELTADIRARFHLDAGQDAVMRQLATSEILLVQGPPGTGKSFIGCRVVEAYVRYKQLVASGDVLQKVDVDLLRSTKPEELLPKVGPVVVITYKNHALDEFLVDLLDSGLWDMNRPRVGQLLAAASSLTTASATSGVPGQQSRHQDQFPGGRRLVRIGGRSREPRLDGYNLNSLLHTKTDKMAINSLKERIFVLNQRLDRLSKEIQYLESGRVPRAYFERWLTPEQRQHITFEDREEWLRGGRYVGVSPRSAEKTLYLDLLRTHMATALAASSGAATSAATTTTTTAANSTTTNETEKATKRGQTTATAEDEEDVSLSVFQEMKREDESREFNESLHSTYVSAEAIALTKNPPSLPHGVPEDLMSLWSLDPVTRHEYYAYLIQQSIAGKAKDCITIMRAIKNVVAIRNHATDEAKLALLQGADVIGLTTTGCAMNQNLIRSLRPSVLVVEEAAEVLESQLLACMTDSLRQIVLIGDHYQLQPKVDTFLYEKVNHLNLSLFERLAQHMTPIRLTEQRRMHPAISQLVRPFYDTQPLIDHVSIATRPFITATGLRLVDRVPGLAKRVFFWRHDDPEEEAPGSRSKVNTREIRMVQQVVTHLVAEGVMQKSITVITPYLGQCRMLRSVMRLSSLADIRVSTVDLYQGDENDIIVLSLVRTEKLTEFIRMRNRLIVSCSRARFAMVMVGNDRLLRQCAHWDQVLTYLGQQDCVGDRLPITNKEKPQEVRWMEVHGTTTAAALEKDIEQGLGKRSREAARAAKAPRSEASTPAHTANTAGDNVEELPTTNEETDGDGELADSVVQQGAMEEDEAESDMVDDNDDAIRNEVNDDGGNEEEE